MDGESDGRASGGVKGPLNQCVKALKGVDEIVDTEIADKIQIRLNMVRKALHRLCDHSLAALRQSRDKETGWFIFNWRLQPDQLEGFILKQKRHVLEKLETRELRYS